MKNIRKKFKNLILGFVFIVLIGIFDTVTVLDTSTNYTADDYSYGKAKNYDKVGHTTLGYMSGNTSDYSIEGRTYYFSNTPRKPNDYYGNYDNGGWVLQNDYKWDETSVQKASDWGYLTKSDGYRWVTDGGHKHKYRKGVYLHYKRSGTLTETSGYVSGSRYTSGLNYWVRPGDTIKFWAQGVDTYDIDRVYMHAYNISTGEGIYRLVNQAGTQWEPSESSIIDWTTSTINTSNSKTFKVEFPLKIQSNSGDYTYKIRNAAANATGQSTGWIDKGIRVNVDGTAPDLTVSKSSSGWTTVNGDTTKTITLSSNGYWKKN